MNEFKGLYKQLRNADMTERQSEIIANELSKINANLNAVNDEVGNLHTKIDGGFKELKELIEKKCK